MARSYRVKAPKAIARRNLKGGIKSGKARDTKERDIAIHYAYVYLRFNSPRSSYHIDDVRKGCQAFYDLRQIYSDNIEMTNGRTQIQAVKILSDTTKLSKSMIRKITKKARGM